MNESNGRHQTVAVGGQVVGKLGSGRALMALHTGKPVQPILYRQLELLEPLNSRNVLPSLLLLSPNDIIDLLVPEQQHECFGRHQTHSLTVSTGSGARLKGNEHMDPVHRILPIRSDITINETQWSPIARGARPARLE